MRRLNQRGMSLIEVLAVVILVGILAGIGIVAVGKYLQKARDNSYENMGKTLYESTKSYFVTNSNKIPAINNKQTILASTLVSEGYTESLKNPKKGDDCNNSTVVVERKADSSDTFNMDLKYTITIKCGSKQEGVFTYPKEGK